MLDPTIICPTCSTTIKLTESLAAPMMEAAKKDFATKLTQKDKEWEDRLTREKKDIKTEAHMKAEQAVASELSALEEKLKNTEEILKANNEKLGTAQKAQAELIKKERELDDSRREMQLTIERQVSESLTTVRAQARQEAEDGLNLKVLEKEQIIASMAAKIEDLKRKAEQGSQQLQGEVLELQLEELLRQKFLTDIIEPVPKGIHGGDIVHRVIDKLGKHCGTLLWETKRTKNWKDEWLSKLRGDQRAANAEIAIILSQVLPKEVTTFDLIDGVWVSDPKYALPLTVVLRRMLMDLQASKIVKEGQQTKMEILYTYLTGVRFRQRVQHIVEKLAALREDLDKERKSMTRSWAKREEQTQEIAESMAGMYGDLQGIAALQEIEGLALIEG